MSKIILGIDPALGCSGWGVIKADNSKVFYLDSGRIQTTTDSSIEKRLYHIHNSINDIIMQYQPVIVAVEETFINKNAASSLKLGLARGAIISAIGKYDVRFMEFSPNAVKKTVVGVGHAEKTQILHMIKLILNSTDIKHLDEADALAIAYTAYATPQSYTKF